MEETVPLVIYLNGQREVLGEAVVDEGGTTILVVQHELIEKALATDILYGDQVPVTKGQDDPIKEVMDKAANFGEWVRIFEDQDMMRERRVARKAWVSLRNQIKGTPLEDQARSVYWDAYGGVIPTQPCYVGSTNICVAEGCFGKSCLKSKGE